MPVNPGAATVESQEAVRQRLAAAAVQRTTGLRPNHPDYAAALNAQLKKSPEQMLRDGDITANDYAAAITDNSKYYEDSLASGAATGASPGVTIDTNAYGTTADQQLIEDTTWAALYDSTHQEADRYDIGQFDIGNPTPTRVNYNYANELTNLNAGIDLRGSIARFEPDEFNDAVSTSYDYLDRSRQNSAQRDAEDLLASAAAGGQPSAAVNMVNAQRGRINADYQNASIDAQQRARYGSDAALAAQYALAASARGGMSGLAGLQAQNNAAQAQTQLYQRSFDDIAAAERTRSLGMNEATYEGARLRADEMENARSALAGFGSDLRNQELAQTSAATQLSAQQLDALRAQAQSNQFNAANAQAASTQQLAWEQENRRLAGEQNLAVSQGNVAQVNQSNTNYQNIQRDVALANQQAALRNDQVAQAAQATYLGSLGSQADTEHAARIKLEQDYQNALQQNAALQNNYDTENATLVQNQQQFEKDRGDRILGSAIGAVGTVAGAAIASDERLKQVGKHSQAADFRDADDYAYTYRQEYQGLPGTDDRHHTGPMADDLPRDTVFTDHDGYKKVDIARLAMRLASAVGKLQREKGAR